MSQRTPKAVSRRDALAGGASFAAALGLPIPFLNHLPAGLTLAANAADQISGKPLLKVLSERPLNLETPPQLLDDTWTPASRLFVRNNGIQPNLIGVTDENWFLQVEGEVERPQRFSIADLKARFEHVTLRLQMECGGNGRRYFSPGASGNQWGFGAVGCPEWTGVRLADVLRHAGVKSTAVYTAHYGADTAFRDIVLFRHGRSLCGIRRLGKP